MEKFLVPGLDLDGCPDFKICSLLGSDLHFPILKINLHLLKQYWLNSSFHNYLFGIVWDSSCSIH